jgi:AcrR family transcriptional regulator
MANRRDAIIEAATALLVDRGLEAVHARTVAAEVGVNHAAVHYYFRRRPDLLRAVIERIQTEIVADVNDGDGSLDSLLRPVPESGSLGAAFASLVVAAHTYPELETDVVQLVEAWVSAVAVRLPGARLKRYLRSAPPEHAARLLVGWVLGSALVGADATELARSALTKD